MCNQYYNQAGFSTPFTTQSTDMEAKNVFQHDQIIRQMDVLNNSVQSYSEQMEKRFQYIERKKRRSCTQKYLSQGSGGEIVLLEQYDDGTVEAKRFFENVSGTWNVLRIKFAFTEEMSSNYAIIFSNGCWIIGDIKKVTETMLYRSFIKAGIRFDARNTEVCIKKVLYETYAPELANCQNTVTIPELAGWYNHKFLHADSTGMICPKDILEIPIYEKHFIFMNKEGSNPKYFIEYIKNIKQINDRISCITILTSGILASILSEHGIERKHFINFIMLNSALSKELINLFTVFNRQVPAVIDASATKREISSFLTKVNDEVLIIDATNEGSYYEKQKSEKTIRTIRKIFIESIDTCHFNRKVNASMVVLNRQISILPGAINIFVDVDFFASNQRNLEGMKWFLPSLVSYIEGHYSHIECIIKQGKDEENAEFLTVWNILKEFFSEYSIDLSEELQVYEENPFEFLNDYQDPADEILASFVDIVRKKVMDYKIRRKSRDAKYSFRSIYISDNKVWIPVRILKNFLKESGLEDSRQSILLDLKSKGKLFTDGEGLSVRMQVDGVREEAYVFAIDIFEVIGRVPFESLGQEDKEDDKRSGRKDVHIFKPKAK